MRLRSSIFIWPIFPLTLVFCSTQFPNLNVNALIPLIPLVGWVAWEHGQTAGLITTIVLMFFIAYHVSFAYADIAEYPSLKASGPVICIIVAVIMETLHSGQSAIKRTTEILNQQIAERDHKLTKLTRRLLSSSEERRNNRGEELHDGIGQQLTGARLLTASIAEQLRHENSSSANTASQLAAQIMTTHDQIRRVARLLFPIRINDVGLSAALMEFNSSLLEINQVNITTETSVDTSEITDFASLQIYRICQEATMRLIGAGGAKTIHISLTRIEENLELTLQHDGPTEPWTEAHSFTRLIDYRLSLMGGMFRRETTTDTLKKITFTIPVHFSPRPS